MKRARMTDERLAEIETANHWPRRVAEELLQALKAEREHFERCRAAWSVNVMSERITELEARLATMEQAYEEGITYGQFKAALGGDDG